jgi:hypothetical protein
MDWMIGSQFLAALGNRFFLHHHIQISSETHSLSYPVDTRGSFPGVKAARE